MRKSTSTDNLSSEAYNKRKGGSKENENRKKQREIINLAALLEVEKYMVFFFFPALWKIQPLAKSQLRFYLGLSFFFVAFLIMNLFGS